MKGISILNIGYGNFICASEVVTIVAPNSVPIKRLIKEARQQKRLTDTTNGKRTRAVIITYHGEILLSALRPETISHRFENPISAEESVDVDVDEADDGAIDETDDA